jgi:hypothetical protein
VADDQANHHQLYGQLNMIELRFKRFASLQKAKPTSREAKAFHARLTAHLDSADNRRVLLTWILMSGMNSGIPEQCGLDCTLRRMLDYDGSRHKIALLSALLELPGFSLAKAPAMSGEVFSAPACREFLDVHESKGTEWFSKERFEELGEWLAITGLIDSGTLPISSGVVTAAMIKAEDVLNQSCELAAAAGYRTGLYRRMLAEHG